jgi:hypothetical protein
MGVPAPRSGFKKIIRNPDLLVSDEPEIGEILLG